MKLTIRIPSHGTVDLDDVGEATETALLRYRAGLRGLDPDMCLVRIRCDLVNYGMVDDSAAMQEVTVDIEHELATWLDNLAAFVNPVIVHRGATVKAIVRVALRFFCVQAPELGGRMKSGVDGTAEKEEEKI